MSLVLTADMKAKYLLNAILIDQADRDRYIMEPVFKACVYALVHELVPQYLDEARKASGESVEIAKARLRAIMEESPVWYLRKEGS